ncbi:MAG: universal stress protein [Candidatus Lokiarchaeota archaeon]|nr:universal stress protein [Candidatus Lokiarchaeota archaeon]
MYKKILVGIDGSESSLDAVKEALEIQKRDKSEVTVFYSLTYNLYEYIPTFTFLGRPTSAIPYALQHEQINEVNELLNSVQELFEKEGQKVETRLIFDINPEDYIKKVAKTEKFDLVILGSKEKHSKLKTIFSEPIPDKVVNSISSDVLVVR